MVEVSNVVVSGKGRRYRRRWQERRRPGAEVDRLFAKTSEAAIAEIHAFAPRAETTYELVCGDCRDALPQHSRTDLAVFSPPYPNSFDYTDVYNVELWTLGYLTDAASNQALRRSTLCSHVQISRNFPPAPSGSPLLATAVASLKAVREELWSPWIPEMVGGYFADVLSVLKATANRLSPGGSAWVVVGNSRYMNIQIDTAAILVELAPKANLQVSLVEPFRSMRASAQQGGRQELAETLLVLKRCW